MMPSKSEQIRIMTELMADYRRPPIEEDPPAEELLKHLKAEATALRSKIYPMAARRVAKGLSNDHDTLDHDREMKALMAEDYSPGESYEIRRKLFIYIQMDNV